MRQFCNDEDCPRSFTCSIFHIAGGKLRSESRVVVGSSMPSCGKLICGSLSSVTVQTVWLVVWLSPHTMHVPHTSWSSGRSACGSPIRRVAHVILATSHDLMILNLLRLFYLSRLKRQVIVGFFHLIVFFVYLVFNFKPLSIPRGI